MIARLFIVFPDGDGFIARQWQTGRDGMGKPIAQGWTGEELRRPTLAAMAVALVLRHCARLNSPRTIAIVQAQHPDALQVWA